MITQSLLDSFKLRPEMIPKTSFYKNLRSMMTSAEWDVLRKACYAAAGDVCEVCRGTGRCHPVECHEVWDFNKETRKQTLKRLIALCPACHEVVHFGLAGVRGRAAAATEHLMKVNEISREDAEIVIDSAWDLWEERNAIKWDVDISAVYPGAKP